MLSAFISSRRSYPAVPLARQLVHQRSVHPGPLVLRTAPFKSPAPSKPNSETRFSFAHKRLHSSSLTLRSSPRLISIGQLHASQHFHLRPINDIVYVEPYSIKDERSNLRESFTLRCFQRLSRPDVATQLCPWQDNWCTRGLSIPVLSY